MRRRPFVSPALVLLAAGVLLLPALRVAPSGVSASAGLGRWPVERPLALAEGESGEAGQDHAADYFEWWYGQRAFPHDTIPAQGYAQAWAYTEQVLRPAARQAAGGQLQATDWANIGPDNVAGRVLSLAIDPTDTLTIWAGTASGGLWRSQTGGQGADAWDRVETGFPALAVSCIALDPANPDTMYIGTGEVGRYGRGQVGTPGSRSSYGLGVLKSTDRGATWSTTGLNWLIDQRRGVQALRMQPSNPRVLWAATTEGLYKTLDGGANWSVMNPLLMCMDVAVHPLTPNTVFAAFGQLGTPAAPDAGLYRTQDGGVTWTKLTSILPATNFGRTALSISKGGGVLYAGIANASTSRITALYRTLNNGTTWTSRSTVNYAASQAWYDNVVACSPADSNRVFAAGLDVYLSTAGGASLTPKTDWSIGYEQSVPPGGPEGPVQYVHADQHAIVFNPKNPNVVYVGCDGGVFKSGDGGTKWAGVNGGLVTTQFYSGFADAAPPSDIAIGGLQDNGTVRYNTTNNSWDKIFGGDGGWCAIDPTDPNILYEEYVYSNIYKSTDGGLNWVEIHPIGGSTTANFIAPFVLCPSAPNVLYAGRLAVEKSVDGGANWSYPDGNASWNGTPLATIGVSATSPDTLVAATGSSAAGAIIEVRRSVDGGASWQTAATALPTLFPTDVAFNPNAGAQVWLSFSGYGSPHVFKSSDAGLNWTNQSGNLPDIPTQCVVVDPADSNAVYVGTDLGVYESFDGGATWAPASTGMPPAMVTDLVIERVARRMRAATFGNGVYERTLPAPVSGVAENGGPGGTTPPVTLAAPTPNPFRTRTTLRVALATAGPLTLDIFDLSGRRVRRLAEGDFAAGEHAYAWDGRTDAGARAVEGIYFARLFAGGRQAGRKITLAR